MQYFSTWKKWENIVDRQRKDWKNFKIAETYIFHWWRQTLIRPTNFPHKFLQLIFAEYATRALAFNKDHTRLFLNRRLTHHTAYLLDDVDGVEAVGLASVALA